MSNVSKFQNYDTETINRQDIRNAAYNPRLIDKEAKKRLKNAIRKHGLVSALTWNRRTGNLVGGHQRIEQLDALEGRSDYDLTVCVIDVDEREEALLNVQLNNPSMQGDWDMEKLADMAVDFDLSFDDMGFSQMDVDFLFDGDDRFSELFDTPEAELVKGQLEEIKEARANSMEKLKERNSVNFYTIVVFSDEKERDQFMREISIPTYEEYVTADQVRRLAKPKD